MRHPCRKARRASMPAAPAHSAYKDPTRAPMAPPPVIAHIARLEKACAGYSGLEPHRKPRPTRLIRPAKNHRDQRIICFVQLLTLIVYKYKARAPSLSPLQRLCSAQIVLHGRSADSRKQEFMSPCRIPIKEGMIWVTFGCNDVVKVIHIPPPLIHTLFPIEQLSTIPERTIHKLSTRCRTP